MGGKILDAEFDAENVFGKIHLEGDIVPQTIHGTLSTDKPEEVFDFNKQARYTTADGKDWIDRCFETMTLEEFRGAMKFTIGKYMERFGKKDDPTLEAKKIADYAKRWYDKELEYKQMREEENK